ncbi:hypothetical protein [Mesorhizobium wenxiniae]|uniref:hypothetical protein n=1 Tax=Mesorhizobium wenxiniae TaxID=2014805 RepID=UPI001FD8B788|nr:hypothetical protein [Mesorhizobium wenxiniae]
MIADREIEQFLGAVLHKLQRRHDAQCRQSLRLVSGETVKNLHQKLHSPLGIGHKLWPGQWTTHLPWPAINNR